MFRSRKTARLLFLAATLVLAYISIFIIAPPSFWRNKSQEFLSSIKSFYSKGTGHLDLENSTDFDQKVHEISVEKLGDGASRTLYFLRPDYKPKTKISAPGYFLRSDEKTSKPLVQPSDPRFTLSVYYEWIRENPHKPVPFHWSDWVDLSLLNKYVLLPQGSKISCQRLFELDNGQKAKSATLGVDQYCIADETTRLGFNVTKFPKAQTRHNIRLLGKAFLYQTFPAPTRLILLTNSQGSYHIDIENSENDLKHSLLQNGMPESVLASKNTADLDVVESYNSLLKGKRPNVQPHEEPSQIALEESWFDFDVEQTIQELQDKNKNSQEENYLSSLVRSKEAGYPDKSFREVMLLDWDKQKKYGDHYDWRFFDGLTIDTDKQVLALHRVLKNYLQFCRTHGLVTWVAHGSLLSWYWNGMIFPWDADTDVQMPLRDLHRLAREFNQTLVVENAGHDTPDSKTSAMEFNGMGAYFIDVGTSITHRTQENGLNSIDARFIDIRTGLYVDITGLAVSDEVAPPRYGIPAVAEGERVKAANKLKKVYNCRNMHFSSLDELSPLAKTVIQNEIGYVPQDFSPMLRHEYSNAGMSQHSFNGYYYLSPLRLWVKSRVISDYYKDPAKWVNTQRGIEARDANSIDTSQFSHLSEADLTNLLYNNWILREYLSGRNFTHFHETQMNFLLGDEMEEYFSNLQEFAFGKEVNRPLWADLFMNEIDINGWNYENEVRKTLVLMELYREQERQAAKEREAVKAREAAREKEAAKAREVAKEREAAREREVVREREAAIEREIAKEREAAIEREIAKEREAAKESVSVKEAESVRRTDSAKETESVRRTESATETEAAN